MLGPLTNPANPGFQSVGVFSLEMTRLYAYLMQKTNRNYTIIHALDGYDEISLTGDFKTIDNQGEHYHSLDSLGMNRLHPSAIAGGDTVEEAATIFTHILNGEGTDEQNQVVLKNAAFAIQTMKPQKTFSTCYAEAQDSLKGKYALESFRKLLQVN